MMKYVNKYCKHIFFIILLFILFFNGINALAKTIVQDNVIYDVFEDEYDTSKYASLIDGKNANENFEIPQYIFDNDIAYEVNNIANEAFKGSNVACVIIPETVKSIGIRAFLDCKKLTTVDFPSGEMHIYDYAFYGSGLINLKIHSGKYYIENSVFSNCTELKTVDIESGVEYIGSNAFSWCANLESVSLPDGLTEIREMAFYYCTKLISLEMPDSVIVLGKGAFSWCKNLENVKISSSITKIEDQTFSRCSKLVSIIIPNSVRSIGSYAFDGCGSLTYMEIPQGVTSLGERAFGNSLEEEQTKLREVVCVKDSFIDNSDHFFEWNQYGITYPEFSYKVSNTPMSGSIFGEYTFMAYFAVAILLIVIICGIVLIFHNKSKNKI